MSGTSSLSSMPGPVKALLVVTVGLCALGAAPTANSLVHTVFHASGQAAKIVTTNAPALTDGFNSDPTVAAPTPTPTPTAP